MKILFSSYHNPNFLTCTEYAENAIRDLGHDLASFDNRKYVIPGRLRNKFQIFENIDLKRMNSNLINLVDKFKPEIFIEMGGVRILPSTLQLMNKKKIKTVLWTTDVEFYRNIVKTASFYDHIFCAGTEAIESLEKFNDIKGATLLPFAFDPKYHKPEYCPISRDITFIGSFYPNRAEILEQLVEFDIQVAGPGWKRLNNNSKLKKIAVDKQLKENEWVDLYNSSKIIIAVHFQDGKSLSYQSSPKVFEALACKKFLLVDNQKDVKTLFQDGRHLIIYNDVNDLKNKIKYFLDNPDKREEIASRGYEYALKEHTYQHRIKTLLSILQKNS